MAKTPSKASMAWESIKDSAASLPRRAVGVVKDALTPQPTVNVIEDRKRRMQEALDAAEGAPEKEQGMKKGGKVKARGVGCAVKGHGKGKFR